MKRDQKFVFSPFSAIAVQMIGGENSCHTEHARMKRNRFWDLPFSAISRENGHESVYFSSKVMGPKVI